MMPPPTVLGWPTRPPGALLSKLQWLYFLIKTKETTMTATAMRKKDPACDIDKKEMVLESLKEQNIEFLLAQFVDIHGAPRVKQVPLNAFNDIVEKGAGFAGAAVWGMGMGPEDHDLMARTDLDTFIKLPWQPNVAMASSDLYVDGVPWPYCPRNNLKREFMRHVTPWEVSRSLTLL